MTFPTRSVKLVQVTLEPRDDGVWAKFSDDRAQIGPFVNETEASTYLYYTHGVPMPEGL